MTNPEDKGGKDAPPQGNAPSWVDEVLGGSRAAPTPPAEAPSAPPVTPAAPMPPAPSAPSAPSAAKPAWPEDLRIPEPAPRPAPAAPAAPTMPPADDWVARATGTQAKNPSIPSGPAVTPAPIKSDFETISDTARSAIQQFGAQASSGDASQKKLIAGLLAIFLGSLGVHKFYLGMNTPGLLLLGVNVGVWIVAVLLGLLTLGVGLVFTIPLASLVSGALGLLGLVEGIIYLTKSDADFQREYIQGKKPWL